MEFTYNGVNYRLRRGVGTNRWLLIGLVVGTEDGWRLLNSFDAGIHEVDIVQHAINSLKDFN